MSAEKQRILIVSHTFPPYAGIGGRRWAKFAKYLQLKNFDVRVLCANLGNQKGSPWEKDVAHIIQHTYPHKFPTVLTKSYHHFFEKIQYRIWLSYLKRKSKGSPYDKALLDEGAFHSSFMHVMDCFKPNVIIGTGAPFRLLSYIADHIPVFPNVSFVADFRDPWTWGESYGYRHLPSQKLEFEEKLEADVVRKFDRVISPWPDLIEKLKEKFPKKESDICVIPHGYDKDDFPGDKLSHSTKKIKYILGGTIYSGLENQLKEVFRFFQENHSICHLDIYSKDISKLPEITIGVEWHQPVQVKFFFTQVAKSDRIIFLIPEHLKDGVPTKLFEYAYIGHPIYMIGYRGKLSELVESKGIGIFVDSIENLKSHFPGNDAGENAWLKEFDYDAVTDQLIKLIEEIKDER